MNATVTFLQVKTLYPQVGYVEMNPDAIWKGFISVVKGAVQGMVATFAVVCHLQTQIKSIFFTKLKISQRNYEYITN